MKKRLFMKMVPVILLCLAANFGFSQVRIKLRTAKRPDRKYEFVNFADTAFVQIFHGEDMGAWYAVEYQLKLHIPDGEYQIYYNNTLELKAFIKNFQRDSVWTSYYENGNAKIITRYKNGVLNGLKIVYLDNTNKISNKYYYKDGKVVKSAVSVTN